MQRSAKTESIRIRDPTSCHTSVTQSFLGVDGRVGGCNRKFNILLLHFQLPDISADKLVGAKLGLLVSGQTGGGLNGVLDGLGIRGATQEVALALQVPGDYSTGILDAPGSTAALITSSFIPENFGDGEFVHSSLELTEYIRGLLEEGGASLFMTLRVTGATDLGCTNSCFHDCLFKRYSIDGSNVRLTLTSLDA